jgi:hypothetical protein
MYQAWWVGPLLFAMALGSGLRRHRLRSGGRVTPRDVVLVMGCAWAVGWLCLGLAAWADWSGYIRWPDASFALLLLCVIAFAPLGLLLAAVWLPRLIRGTTGKKPVAPHPFD